MGHPRFLFWRLSIGPFGKNNYVLHVWDHEIAGEEKYVLITNLSGYSDAINDEVNEFTEMTLLHRNGQFALLAGGVELFRLNSANQTFRGADLDHMLESVETIWLGSVSEGTASFDWAYASGTEVGASAGEPGGAATHGRLSASSGRRETGAAGEPDRHYPSREGSIGGAMMACTPGVPRRSFGSRRGACGGDARCSPGGPLLWRRYGHARAHDTYPADGVRAREGHAGAGGGHRRGGRYGPREGDRLQRSRAADLRCRGDVDERRAHDRHRRRDGARDRPEGGQREPRRHVGAGRGDRPRHRAKPGSGDAHRPVRRRLRPRLDQQYELGLGRADREAGTASWRMRSPA